MKFRFSAVFMVLIFNIISYATLIFYPDVANRKELVIGMIAICSFITLTYIVLYAFKLGDVYPFLIVAMLASISIIILYSLAIQRYKAYIDTDYDSAVKLLNIAKNQVVWFLSGIVIFFITYFIYRIVKVWNKMFWFYVVGAVALFMVAVLFAKDNVQKGVKNWINIGGISLQPSEFVKLCFCFAMACLFSTKEKLTGFKNKLIGVTKADIYAVIFMYLCFGFFVLLGELGTAMLFFCVYFSLMIAYDVPFAIPLGNVALITCACLMLYLLSHISDTIHSKLQMLMVRYYIWRDPNVTFPELKMDGWQILKSLEFITTGGFFGVGLGCSSAYWLSAIESDVVFSAICYEMGIFMGFAVLLMYFILAYRGLKIAMEVSAPFDKSLATIISISFFLQAFIIIAGVTNFIPLTGITMPFVSAGGSSMIVSFALLGILTAISHKKEKSKLIG